MKTEKLIEKMREKFGIPYIDVICCKEYHELFRYTSGTIEKGNKRLRMFSCSKVITSVVALRLIEEGKLSLDDKVFHYLPEVKNAFILNENNQRIVVGDQITVYQLFTMTAGFTYNVKTHPITELASKSEGRAQLRDFIAKFVETPLSFVPGTRFQYSLCHDILAAVVEIITKKPFSQYVEEVIFKPLGMKDSTFNNSSSQLADLFLADVDGGISKIENQNSLLPTNAYESGGAGLISTVDDYILFANALACKGVAKNGYRVLKEETLKLLATERFKSLSIDNGFTCVQGDEYGYGLGVRVRTVETEWGLPKGEFGWDGAAGSYVMVEPKQKVAIFIGMHVKNWPVFFSGKHLEIVENIYKEFF